MSYELERYIDDRVAELRREIEDKDRRIHDLERQIKDLEFRMDVERKG